MSEEINVISKGDNSSIFEKVMTVNGGLVGLDVGIECSCEYCISEIISGNPNVWLTGTVVYAVAGITGTLIGGVAGKYLGRGINRIHKKLKDS